MTYGFPTDIWPSAPLAVLMFMGTVLLEGSAVLAMLYFTFRRQRGYRNIAAGLALGWLLFYGGLWLGFSLASRETVLAFHEEKHFCEIDCHPAYSVEDVQQAKTLGTGAAQKTAQGMFYVVSLKARFDEKTISSQRGMAPLHPNGRAVMVTDARGRTFAPSAAGQQALETMAGVGNRLDRTFERPGDSYVCKLVFDLPADIQQPRLFLENADLVNRLLIGHENGWLHKRTLFSLSPGLGKVAAEL